MFLTSVAHRGYRRDGAGYLVRSLPPVEFGYTPAALDGSLHEVDPGSVANLPAGVGAAGHLWADLDGEGISGVLVTGPDSWSYKPNLGDGVLGPLRSVPGMPAPAVGAPPAPALLDLAGDGRLDVVTLGWPMPGFVARTADGGWLPWRAFEAFPAHDLDGDGHPDLLVTEGESLTWYPSLAEAGFGPGITLPTGLAADAGPVPVLTDATRSVQLADMSGDGLADLVRIENGAVCYWPSLGYGRFGRPVTMDDAPRFDSDERFDPASLRLADVDGSGTTDLIHLGADGVRIHLNRGGDGWAPPVLLPGLPPADVGTAVDAVDLLGSGTTCLVWSSTHATDAGVVGPYATVNCTLTLLSSTIRTSPSVGGGYARDGEDTARFSDYYGGVQAIVTSTGSGDSGLFETNLGDERYLPFEGPGPSASGGSSCPPTCRSSTTARSRTSCCTCATRRGRAASRCAARRPPRCRRRSPPRRPSGPSGCCRCGRSSPPTGPASRPRPWPPARLRRR